MKIIKTLVLVISGVVGGGLLWIYNVGVIQFCGDEWTCLNRFPVENFTDAMRTLAFPALSLFLFSLITFRMRDAIFRPWFYFALGWIPLSVYLTAITPADNHGSWLDINPFEKARVSIFLSALFVFISTIIIAVAWWKQRRKIQRNG